MKNIIRIPTVQLLKPIKKVEAGKHPKWLYECKCGVQKIIDKYAVDTNHTKSCGHLLRKHNMYGTVTYRVWLRMMQRCYNVNDKAYTNYGGRGITVSEPWKTFENFFKDMGVKPGIGTEFSIERINNEKGYSKQNCKWATMKEQGNNRRTNKNYKERYAKN